VDGATREDILNRINQSLEQMKDSLNLLMSGEMAAEDQKEIAEAIKKVFDKSEKNIPKAATHLIDSLMKGSCSKDNITSLVPRSIGTIWEVLLIGQIQLHIMDAHYPGQILEKGESPDLTNLDVDIKSVSKDGGEGTSASAKGNTVIDLGRMRILGLDYDVLYIRYEGNTITRLEFIGRGEFADYYCYNLMKGATEAMLEGGLGDEERFFLCCLASHLTLKQNPKKNYDDPRVILDWIIHSIIRDDIAYSARRGKDGISQARMKAMIRMWKKWMEERGKEAKKKALKKLGGLKQGDSLEETQAEFRKVFDIDDWLDMLHSGYVVHLAELEKPPPKGSSKKAKLLWLTPIIQLVLAYATNFPDSQVEHMISRFTSEGEPKFKTGTKGYELVLNFAQEDPP